MPFKKHPIDVGKYSSQFDTDISIADACIEYLKQEYHDLLLDLDQHINQHFQQRLQTGESLAVRVTDIQTGHDDSQEITITCDVDYSRLPYSSPEQILSSLRMKANQDSGTGSFVKAIPATPQLEPMISNSLSALHRCPVFTIENIDINDDLTTGTITLNGLQNYRSSSTFLYAQPHINVADTDDPTDVSSGDIFILDPTPDDHTAEAAYHTLQHPELNDTITLIESLINDTHDNQSSRFDTSIVQRFLGWMNDDNSDPLAPNSGQQAFIRDTEHELTLLQGPPGTGKTTGAIAPAIVSRLLASNTDHPCRTLVTGASNKSIDEVFESTHELLTQYIDDPQTTDNLDDVLFVRVQQPSDDQPVNPPDDAPYDVAYTAFYKDEQQDKWIDEIYKRLQQSTTDSNKHIVVFATPRRVWRLGNAVIDDFVFTDDVDSDVTPSVPEAYRLFDHIVVDEASMMELPPFLLATTFYKRGGNIMLAGDHRQLPPVQHHDWDTEFTPAVLTTPPFLSILNFARLMRGDELTTLNDDFDALLDHASITSSATIPLHQLSQTYRCHKRIATFLDKWVYNNLDNTPYKSTQTNTLPAPTQQAPDGLLETIRPEQPLTLITYDDYQYQQTNPLESAITVALIDHLPDDDIGVITPHNAQRGQLQRQLQQSLDIDTVERFQGGERNTIILNSTVSDPNYIAAESEFLLNLNRLNVAMSRMKHKLIIIASTAIFSHIPLDPDEYDQTLLWKGLAREAALDTQDQTAAWTGTLDTYLPQRYQDNHLDLNTKISIYHL